MKSWFCCMMVLGMDGVLLGQGVPETQSLIDSPDLLMGWNANVDGALDEGESRLHVTLLRMPKAEAARLLLEDDGQEGEPKWEEKLRKLKEAGKWDSVKVWESEKSGSAGTWEAGRRDELRYVTLNYGADFWQRLQEAKDYDLPAPDMMRLINDTSEVEVGDHMSVKYELVPGTDLVKLNAELFYNPLPLMMLNNPTWPLPGMSLPTVISRPWKLSNGGTVSRERIFFLGAQMDVWDGVVANSISKTDLLSQLQDEWELGEKNDDVLLAFGKVTMGQKRKAMAEDANTSIVVSNSEWRLQTWTLAVEPKLAVTKGELQDGEALLERLVTLSEKGEGVELLASAAMLVAQGEEAMIRGERAWESPNGFEPCDTMKDYRVRPNEMPQHFSAHWLEATCVRAANEAGNGYGAMLALNLAAGRPSAPVKWWRWKSAMERDESDPGAVMISESDSVRGAGSHAVMLIRGMRMRQATLVSSGMKDGKEVVTFARVVESDVKRHEPGAAAEKKEEALRVPVDSLTVWALETPLDWGAKIWRGSEVDATALGEELLKDGSVKTVNMHFQRLGTGGGSYGQIGELRVFAGRYLNTELHEQGIFFNPREVERALMGDEYRFGFSNSVKPMGDRRSVDLHLDSRKEPKWNHFGIWPQDARGLKAENSGVKLPEFPWNEMKTSVGLQPGVPQVVAVSREASVVGKEGKREQSCLRWVVAKLEASLLIDRQVKPDEFGTDDGPRMVQAVVLRGLPVDAKSEEWVAALREGKCEVLDALMMGVSGEGKGKMVTGSDYHFVNGRAVAGGRDEDVADDQVQMEARTSFDHQVDVQRKGKGLQLEVRGGQWSVERDAEAPQVVTDRFPNTITEWPFGRDSKWEQMPKVTVCVQRPIFAVQRAKGGLPALGGAVVERLSNGEVVLVRSVPVRTEK